MGDTNPWSMTEPQDAPPELERPAGINGLGLAGFIVGIVSLCALSGLISPIGLILSVFGLFRRPRGWAVAGTLVSALGCCCCLPLSLPLVLVAAQIVSVSAMVLWITTNFAGVLGKPGITIFHGVVIGLMLTFFHADSNTIPTSLDELKLDRQVLLDGWGRPFDYTVTDNPEGYLLSSPGGDGAAGTADDVEFTGTVRNGTLEFDGGPKRGRRGQAPPAVPPLQVPEAPDAPKESSPSDEPANAPTESP